ncbi:MAG: DUF433 domain-containing protein [Planctomycetaceae bacterium]
MSGTTHLLNTEYAHIVCTPHLFGGEPHVAGHRIRVRDIVAARDKGGCTPEEISGTVYPALTLAEVYAALAYYEDHREEIDRAALAEAKIIDEFQQRHPELIGQPPKRPASQ